MVSLRAGTVLLRKYRVDRLRMQCGGVSVYDATDTTRSRPVRLHVHRRGAPVRTRPETLVDIGVLGGLTFYVEPDVDCTPLVRRSKPPPPLPAPKKKSIPPPLPSSKKKSIPPPLPIVDVPLVAVDEEPAPIIEVDTEPFERAMRSTRRSRWAIAIVAAAALTGFAGWYVGSERSSVETTMTPPPIVETERQVTSPTNEPRSEPVAVEPKPTPAHTATTAAPKPHVAQLADDPLTL